MKYRQLTKEQFENLHEEFAKFLASQQIDVNEWNDIKKNKPHVAEEEMNIFSDLVWEDVLSKAKYLEHFSKDTINLFKCNEDDIQRIVVKVNKEINLLEDEGYQWLINNSQDNTIDFFQGTKKYSDKKNTEIFNLIEQGSILSKGILFEYFHKIIN